MAKAVRRTNPYCHYCRIIILYSSYDCFQPFGASKKQKIRINN
jgi:hypothetical protein